VRDNKPVKPARRLISTRTWRAEEVRMRTPQARNADRSMVLTLKAAGSEDTALVFDG
jgi:hypothetical protein